MIKNSEILKRKQIEIENAKKYFEDTTQKYIDDQMVIIYQKIKEKKEHIIDFKAFKQYVKNQIKNYSLNHLDISTIDASTRNVRETYTYREFLDNVYSSFIKLDHINGFQDLIMNSLNELRGGCTNSLKGETEETIEKIQDCLDDIDEYNYKISNAKSPTAKKQFEDEKATYISDFDKNIENRSKQDKDIERPSEKLRPMNPEGKDRTYTLETTIYNTIIHYIKDKKSPEVKIVEKTVDREVEVVKKEFIKVPVEKIVPVPYKEPPKPQIQFDGTDGFYKLNVNDETKIFKPTLSKKHIKLFRKLISEEYKTQIPSTFVLTYDPRKVIDVNIYALLSKYDKEHGSSMKDTYVKEVINKCRFDADPKKETSFDIEYDLSQIRKTKSLGSGIYGLIKKHRIKNFASANGQDGIGIAKYIRDKKARTGLIAHTISGKRGSIKRIPPHEIIPIEPPKEHER